ncbi:MAG: G5 domain-containing protein, partial [Acidobacteriota bacterium]
MALSRNFASALLYLLIFFFLAACAPASKRVAIVADGTRRIVDTNAATVQDVLREQRVAVGDNDRVEPPLYAEIDRSATITITRVEVRTDSARQPIPFERQLVRDETYPEGQMRIVQLGSNGEVEITYALTSENGDALPPRETARKIIRQPQNEILAIGTLGSLPGVPVEGSLVYLANGNAWVMRNSSSDKRPLTSTGDLDGRVFSLSATGRYLLFSRAAEAGGESINTLWLIDTLVLGESPRALSVGDVLYAQLSNDARTIAYSTGEKTPGAPGWKAHNDLWVAPLVTGEISATLPASITLNARQVWQPAMPAPYSWWGANLALAPDGHAVAYAFANAIGFSELGGAVSSRRVLLKDFAPFRTRADWVWVPQVAWSPDSRFVIAAVHAPLDNPVVASDNPSFELWALARDGSVYAPLAKQTGMWAAPAWSPPDARGESKIAFGVALSPSDSERSRYALYVMDRDGGNKQQIFPQDKEEGLLIAQVAWAPSARQLIALRDNDLWLYDFASARWSQLTANGASALPRWG